MERLDFLKKEQLFKINEIVRLVFFLLIPVLGVILIKARSPLLSYFPYLLIIYGVYSLILAIMFKKTAGIWGVYLGKGNFLAGGLYILFSFTLLALILLFANSDKILFLILIIGIPITLFLPDIANRFFIKKDNPNISSPEKTKGRR